MEIALLQTPIHLLHEIVINRQKEAEQDLKTILDYSYLLQKYEQEITAAVEQTVQAETSVLIEPTIQPEPVVLAETTATTLTPEPTPTPTPTPIKKRGWTDEDNFKLIQLYNSSITINQIALKMGRSSGSIDQQLIKLKSDSKFAKLIDRKSSKWTVPELLHLLDWANQKNEKGGCLHHFDYLTDEFKGRSKSSIIYQLNKITSMFPELDLRNYPRFRYGQTYFPEKIEAYNAFKTDLDAGVVEQKINQYLKK